MFISRLLNLVGGFVTCRVFWLYRFYVYEVSFVSLRLFNSILINVVIVGLSIFFFICEILEGWGFFRRFDFLGFGIVFGID